MRANGIESGTYLECRCHAEPEIIDIVTLKHQGLSLSHLPPSSAESRIRKPATSLRTRLIAQRAQLDPFTLIHRQFHAWFHDDNHEANNSRWKTIKALIEENRGRSSASTHSIRLWKMNKALDGYLGTDCYLRTPMMTCMLCSSSIRILDELFHAGLLALFIRRLPVLTAIHLSICSVRDCASIAALLTFYGVV